MNSPFFKYGLVLVLFVLPCRKSSAQAGFKSLRYEEDYRHLGEDSTLNFYERFKYFQPAKNKPLYISQGGEVRFQYQYYINENWGDIPEPSYSSVYSRFLYHSDFHFTPAFRVFAQLNSTTAGGRVTPNRSIDENLLDVQQFFAEAGLSRGWSARLGRQEILFGSQRIIAVREGPNNRQSFDGLRVNWKNGNTKISLLYTHPVKIRRGVLDDRFNKTEKLWGAYGTSSISRLPFSIDYYYLGYYNHSKAYKSGLNAETRHSFGLRGWRFSDKWNFDFETLIQFGSWGSQEINAYTASIDANIRLKSGGWQPTAGVKTEIISGDRNPQDQQLNTFNPLFPRGAYFGLAALIGPSNLIDFHPYITVKPTSKIEMGIDYDVFWRHSRGDGIYGPNVMLLFEQDSRERFIGHQVGLSAEFQPNRFCKISPEVMIFLPGNYLKEVSPGKNTFFAALTIQVKF